MAQTNRHRPPARKKVATRSPPPKRATSPPKRRGPVRGASQGSFLGKSALAVALYGPSGVGKTEWAAHFPDVGFVFDPQEPGISDLVEYNSAPEPLFAEEVMNFNNLLNTCDKIAEGKLKCGTVVFDSLTGMEKLCFQHHCREQFGNDWTKEGFYSYQQGPKNAAKTDWPLFVDRLQGIQAAGINVIVLAHSQVKVFNNPDGPDYDRFIPYLDKESWQVVHRWAKAVFFYNFDVDVDKKGLKNKAKKGSERRYIYTSWSPAYDAKNRYGLPDHIDAGSSGKEAYANFVKAFSKR